MVWCVGQMSVNASRTSCWFENTLVSLFLPGSRTLFHPSTCIFLLCRTNLVC